MTWDKTEPDGSESWTDGAAAIRSWRADSATALNTDGRWPGADTAVPVFVHKFKVGNTAARPTAAYAGRLYINTETGTIQRDTGSTWENITGPTETIPSGKNLVFYNSAAPTGWTQITTWNDRIIRLTSGTGAGTGGSDSISSPPTHDHGAATGNPDVDLSHVHATNPTMREVRGQASGAPLIHHTSAVNTATGTSGDLDHTHSIAADTAFSPKYADVIVCQR